MLNAYGRVDKGKIIALDRGEDSRSAFGPVIGQTFDHFKVSRNASSRATDEFDQSTSDKMNSDSSSSGSSKSWRDKSSDSNPNSDSALITNTLLSNLLINSVLFALRSGANIVLFVRPQLESKDACPASFSYHSFISSFFFLFYVSSRQLLPALFS